jgi:hypothetical protein
MTPKNKKPKTKPSKNKIDCNSSKFKAFLLQRIVLAK